MATSEEIDWAGLFHAWGRATGVAAQLAALRGTDRDAAFDASVFVLSRLFANGTLSPATVAALPLIAGMLDDPALGGGDPGVRDSLLFFLREVARICTTADVEGIRSRVRLDETVSAWLNAYLARTDPPGVTGWTTQDAPGRVAGCPKGSRLTLYAVPF